MVLSNARMSTFSTLDRYGVDTKILIGCLYVHDLIHTSNDKSMLADFKKAYHEGI